MEMLEQLIARIRRPRQRPQYSPMSEAGGDTPGLRGSINPLDSQAMADRAQGVDISSVAPPTRLLSARMDGDMYAQADQREAAGGDGESVMRTASQPQQYRTQCGPNGCVRVPVGPAQGLPQGIALGPGESLVPGSVRETSSAAQQPVQQMTAGQQPAAPEEAPDYQDAAHWYRKSERHENNAFDAIGRRDAIGAQSHLRIATQSMNVGMMAAALKVESELTKEHSARMDKKLALQQQELDVKSGAFGAKQEQAVREDRTRPVADRVGAIMRNRIANRAMIPGFQLNPDDLAKEEATETGVIQSQDSDYYLNGYLDAKSKADAARQAGGDESEAVAQMRLIDGHMNQLLLNRYGDTKKYPTPAARANAMRSDLMPVYQTTYQKRLADENGEYSHAQVQTEVIKRLRMQEDALEEMIENGGTPYQQYFGGGK